MSVIVTGYRVKRKIADGGFSSVHEALRISDKKTVALKTISPDGMQQAFVRTGFRHEARTLMRLSNEFIVKVLDYTTDADRPTIVMEYFVSENLKRCLLKYYDRITDRAPSVMSQMAQGLRYLHTNNIIHRDVKPENVLLATDGSVRLIDFSLAICTDQWIRNLFQKKRIQGTPLYMAPEQIQNKKIDHRCDIYSLGCVFFEMITRNPPFRASSQQKLLVAHCKEKPASPVRWQRDLPDRVGALVLEMLAKKPEKRPTLEDVIGQLDGVEMVLTEQKAK